MNQVLLDMDTVIKLRESGSSPEKDFTSLIIKEEPADLEELYCDEACEEEGEEDPAVKEEEETNTLTTQTIDPETAIVLNFADQTDIIDSPAPRKLGVKGSIPEKKEPDVSDHDSKSSESRKSTGKRKSSSSTSKSGKKNKTGLEDVTEMYDDDDSEQILCGICQSWDPPHEVGGKKTTEWVGCDCDRWFHKQCTAMKRITTKFSCKSVKMECLVVSITSDKVDHVEDEEIMV